MKQDLTITITARFDGFDTEVCFSGQLDQMPAITKRIRELGGEPVATHTAPLKTPAKKVQPFYDGDGQPCCPVHRKPLSEGRYGLYCSSRATGDQAANDKGYCAIRFSE